MKKLLFGTSKNVPDPADTLSNRTVHFIFCPDVILAPYVNDIGIDDPLSNELNSSNADCFTTPPCSNLNVTLHSPVIDCGATFICALNT